MVLINADTTGVFQVFFSDTTSEVLKTKKRRGKRKENKKTKTK